MSAFSSDLPPSESDAQREPEAPQPRRGPGQGRGPRGERLVRHFKIDHRLTPEDRAQYEALLLDPRSTVDSLLRWLHDKGYTDMSRAGVHRHRKQFELDVKSIRRDARVAGQFAALARFQGGATALADAGQFRFEQVFLEQLFRMKKTDARAGKEWLELARAMAALLDNRRQVEEQRKSNQPAPPKKPLDGVAVADAVRRILGVPLPDEPVPEGDPSRALIEPAHTRPPRRLPPPGDN